MLPADGWGAERPASGSTDNLVKPNVAGPHAGLRPAHHRLRLLLHGDHLRPGEAGRHDAQAGRLHPGHPSRAPDRAVPGQDPLRITLPGALFIAALALVPSLLLTPFLPGTQVPFAGISILIAVGVALETMKQIDSQLMMRNYEGFLK